MPTSFAQGLSIARDVLQGLGAQPKRLPPYLFYDRTGAELFERITELPEYYLTRAERGILVQHAADMVRAAAGDDGTPLDVVEFGAGTAKKSQLVLRALARQQGPTLFMPVDVSAEALGLAETRIHAEERQVQVRALAMHHEQALALVRRPGRRQLAMFIGSSIGNYDHPEAVSLLRGIRSAMSDGSCLLLGTDRRKGEDLLLRAYDDAQGVTAAFNKNMLARINRELGGTFVLEQFRHVALWNNGAGRVEMHLESVVDQDVTLAEVGAHVAFRRGERLHTESSYKYDLVTVERLLGEARFRREATYGDEAGLFWVHLARALDR